MAAAFASGCRMGGSLDPGWVSATTMTIYGITVEWWFGNSCSESAVTGVPATGAHGSC